MYGCRGLRGAAEASVLGRSSRTGLHRAIGRHRRRENRSAASHKRTVGGGRSSCRTRGYRRARTHAQPAARQARHPATRGGRSLIPDGDLGQPIEPTSLSGNPRRRLWSSPTTSNGERQLDLGDGINSRRSTWASGREPRCSDGSRGCSSNLLFDNWIGTYQRRSRDSLAIEANLVRHITETRCKSSHLTSGGLTSLGRRRSPWVVIFCRRRTSWYDRAGTGAILGRTQDPTNVCQKHPDADNIRWHHGLEVRCGPRSSDTR